MKTSKYVQAALLLLATLGIAPSASGSLIDMGAFSRDEASGLDWLDVTETVALSYDQVMSGDGGWGSDGWRYATEAEVRGLLTNHAGATERLEDTSAASIRFLDFVGATTAPPDLIFQSRTYAIFDDSANAPFELLVGRADVFLSYVPGLPESMMWEVSNDMQLRHGANPFVGSFLVRAVAVPSPVSEPGSASLLAIAMLGCAYRFRR